MSDRVIATPIGPGLCRRCTCCRRWFVLRAVRPAERVRWWRPAPGSSAYRCRSCRAEFRFEAGRDARRLH